MPKFFTGYHKAPQLTDEWESQLGSHSPSSCDQGAKIESLSSEIDLSKQYPAFTPRTLYQEHTHCKPPACLQIAPFLSLVGKFLSGCSPLTGGLVRSGLGRGTSRNSVQESEGNPSLVPFCRERERVMILDFCALCPMVWHPDGEGGPQLAPRKEANVGVSGRGIQERRPKPKRIMATTDKQVNLILKLCPKIDKCYTLKSSHLTATASLLEFQETLGNNEWRGILYFTESIKICCIYFLPKFLENLYLCLAGDF